MESPESDTRVLLERWQAGDQESLKRLLVRDVDWIRERARRRMGRRLRQRTDAEDITQETIAKALKYVPRFVVSSKQQFRRLLAKLVENTLCDEADKIRREWPSDDVMLDLDGGGRSPSQIVQEKERTAWVRLALEFLEPGDSAVIVFREYHGFSWSEVSAKMGNSEDAARMHFQRALRRLAATVRELQKRGLSTLLAADPDDPLDPEPERAGPH